MLGQHSHLGTWIEPAKKTIHNNEVGDSESFDKIASLVGRPRAYRFVENKARQLLEEHPHFHGRSDHVRCVCLNNRLVLQGKVPSFYLKQLAQEALRGLADVIRIDNQITVASPAGVITEESFTTGIRRATYASNKPR